MNLYQPFYNGKIGVVDLTTQSTYTVDLPGDALREHIGGAAMNARLLSEYESDSLVLGTGPLTGSFAPASALLVGTFRSPVFDHLCHVPFMLRSGPEMKFSGLDFLIIALLGTIGPVGFYMNAEQSKIKDVERRLPEFLRDIAESGRFGMTLAASIQAAAKGKYGPQIGRASCRERVLAMV
jgi:aldehyde:ferredoxin oxidoreductase